MCGLENKAHVKVNLILQCGNTIIHIISSKTDTVYSESNNIVHAAQLYESTIIVHSHNYTMTKLKVIL